jgi:hypothetical protein
MRLAVIGVLLSAVSVAPLVGSTTVGAVGLPSTEATTHLALAPHATLACGPFTFEWNAAANETVTYFQIHATAVTCTVAKGVVAKAGKYHGVPPAGWTFVGTVVRGSGSYCVSTWKHGAARVSGYLEGC